MLLLLSSPWTPTVRSSELERDLDVSVHFLTEHTDPGSAPSAPAGLSVPQTLISHFTPPQSYTLDFYN